MSELHSFTALIEGQPLTESQWSRLLHVFEIMIKNFYKIQIDKEWYVASSFVEILLQKKPRIVKQIFLSKISVFIANLNAIKKRFPEEWNEFPREKEDNDRQEINKILREEFE